MFEFNITTYLLLLWIPDFWFLTTSASSQFVVSAWIYICVVWRDFLCCISPQVCWMNGLHDNVHQLLNISKPTILSQTNPHSVFSISEVFWPLPCRLGRDVIMYGKAVCIKWVFYVHMMSLAILLIHVMSPIKNVPGGNINILGGHSIGHSKQKVYMYMCPIPNGVRDRAILLCNVLCTLYRRATRRVLTRTAKCIDFDGKICENILY
jgi:hypothetical protein